MDALSAMGRKRDAVTEADTFIAANPTSGLWAQRGYLRREMQDLPGSIQDFTAALAGTELSAEQRQNARLRIGRSPRRVATCAERATVGAGAPHAQQTGGAGRGTSV